MAACSLETSDHSHFHFHINKTAVSIAVAFLTPGTNGGSTARPTIDFPFRGAQLGTLIFIGAPQVGKT